MHPLVDVFVLLINLLVENVLKLLGEVVFWSLSILKELIIPPECEFVYDD